VTRGVSRTELTGAFSWDIKGLILEMPPSRLLKNSEAGEARVVAAVSDRRNSMTYVEATLIERLYHEFFTNLLGPVGGKC
jgi:hypothetical protein